MELQAQTSTSDRKEEDQGISIGMLIGIVLGVMLLMSIAFVVMYKKVLVKQGPKTVIAQAPMGGGSAPTVVVGNPVLGISQDVTQVSAAAGAPMAAK